jgi:hypothetical protein
VAGDAGDDAGAVDARDEESSFACGHADYSVGE